MQLGALNVRQNILLRQPVAKFKDRLETFNPLPQQIADLIVVRTVKRLSNYQNSA